MVSIDYCIHKPLILKTPDFVTILVTEYTWLFLVLMGRLRIFLMRHSSTINFTSPFCSALSIDTDRRLWPRRPYACLHL